MPVIPAGAQRNAGISFFNSRDAGTPFYFDRNMTTFRSDTNTTTLS